MCLHYVHCVKTRLNQTVQKRELFAVYVNQFFYQFQSGLSEKDLQEVRLKVPLEMFTEVKDHLSHGGNPNKENENGITLVRYTVESLEFVLVKQIFVDLVGHPN